MNLSFDSLMVETIGTLKYDVTDFLGMINDCVPAFVTCLSFGVLFIIIMKCLNGGYCSQGAAPDEACMISAFGTSG